MSVSKPAIIRIGGVPQTNYGGKRGIKPTHITDHHIVGDAGSAIAEARKPAREMSFTFTIGSDGRIYQLLELDEWPYTDGSSVSNRRAITIEHAGGHASVPYTEAMYNSSIHLHAWLRQEFGIPESNILRHQQVSEKPTACPGGLDTERIKRGSTKLLGVQPQGDEPMISDTDNEFARWNQLHHQLLKYPGTREVFRQLAVGKTWLKQIEILSDHGDARKHEQADQQKDLYIAAVNNDLKTLRGQVDELSKRPTKQALEDLHENLVVCQEGAEKQAEHIAELEKQKTDIEYNNDKLVTKIVEAIKNLLSSNVISKVLQRNKNEP